jgi:hypothetical protein
MKLIANSLNRCYLSNILPGPEDVEIDGVLAAIAYGSNMDNIRRDFIGQCVENSWRLDIWMRYDHTVPVAIPLLRRLLGLHSSNVFCRFVPDYLHSKVIWWRGYGAYIGSANLTDRAWLTNIEAGVFLKEDELVENGMDNELQLFFDELRVLNKTFPITEELVKEMEQIALKRKGVAGIGKELRSVPEWDGPSFESDASRIDRHRDSFQNEWLRTLTDLRSIGEQLRNYRPSWVDESVPDAWHSDQFLHAFYYNRVGSGGLAIPFEDFHQRNRKNPSAALETEMQWWANLAGPPSNEDITFSINAPFIREHLSEKALPELDITAFTKICEYTHATKDHLIKVPATLFGRPAGVQITREERIPLFANWLWNQRNEQGWDIKRLLQYVLYGGPNDRLWERLYNAGRTPNYSIKRYGLNSLAEVIGWVRPDIAPPRNGRTSKALRALGYDVAIY